MVTNNDTHVSFNPDDQWQRWPSSPGNYMSPSYALTSAQGATVSVKFNGTCIYYYSDKNFDHGAFNVQIDDGDAVELSSYSADSVGPSVLYASPVLGPGEHDLCITNLETDIVAVSFFVYRPSDLPAPSECADPSTPPVSLSVSAPSKDDITVKASDQSLAFTPSGQWEDLGDYKLSYSHGASITFTFTGTNVWYTSDTNWDHGPFSVTLDDSPPMLLSSFSIPGRGNQLLYGSPDLSPGRHTLHLSNEDATGMGIDNFIYRPSPQNGTVSGSPSSSSNGHPSPTEGHPTPSSHQASVKPEARRLSDTAFIGIAVGVVTFIHLCVLAFFVGRHLRRSRRNKQMGLTAPYPYPTRPVDIEGAAVGRPTHTTTGVLVPPRQADRGPSRPSSRWVSFPDN